MRTEHRTEIIHHAVVRGGGGCEKPKIRRKGSGDLLDAPVVGPEIMPPIRNAVNLVNHQEGNAVGDLRQYFGPKALVAKPFG